MDVQTILCEVPAWLTARLLNGLGMEVVREGSRLFHTNAEWGYEIIVECSGVRSVAVLASIALFYGIAILRTLPNIILFTVGSVPVAFGFNLLRLMGVVCVGHWFGTEASARFHVVSGYVSFYLAAALMHVWAGKIKPKGSHPVLPLDRRSAP